MNSSDKATLFFATMHFLNCYIDRLIYSIIIYINNNLRFTVQQKKIIFLIKGNCKFFFHFREYITEQIIKKLIFLFSSIKPVPLGYVQFGQNQFSCHSTLVQEEYSTLDHLDLNSVNITVHLYRRNIQSWTIWI